MGRGNRRSIRLPEYDYSQAGAYFVTIAVLGRQNRLGEIVGGNMRLNTVGKIGKGSWDWLEKTFEAVEVPIFCVMPNHVHAILVIDELDTQGRGGLQTAPTEVPIQRKPLGQLVGAYKTHSTVLINKVEKTPVSRFWQRNYYERVVRNESEYEAVYEYIESNPRNWELDKEYFSGN